VPSGLNDINLMVLSSCLLNTHPNRENRMIKAIARELIELLTMSFINA
jgi:hypothetical protein